MIDLDNVNSIVKLQGGNSVLKSIDSLNKQITRGWEESLEIDFPDRYKNITSAVICGMGGSRFPALIVKELFEDSITVPFVIKNDYRLPKFVDKNTLFILSSYSGTTEEVIMTARLAIEQKAQITGVTSGGKIAAMLKKINAPVYVFKPIYNPSRQPRMGFGYAVGGIIGILFRLGILKIEKETIKDTLKEMPNLIRSFKTNVPLQNNPAKQLAKKIYRKYPYYIVSEFLNGVGNAIANQTNETAKSISDFRIIPELNHHLMEGLKFPDNLKKLAIFIFFYSKFYNQRIQKRFLITREVVKKNQIDTVLHELKGRNKIQQVFELTTFGSYLTMYLSVLYKQDPSVVPYVDYFKKRLKEI